MSAAEPRSCLCRYLPTHIGPPISGRPRVAFLAIDYSRAHAGAGLIPTPLAWRPHISLA
jgi:hypothetical protein